MDAQNFTAKDAEMANRFVSILTKHARFDVSVAELIEVSRALVWFNGLSAKIESNIMEVVRVTKPAAPEVENAVRTE
jgi:hypothetical protein